MYSEYSSTHIKGTFVKTHGKDVSGANVKGLTEVHENFQVFIWAKINSNQAAPNSEWLSAHSFGRSWGKALVEHRWLLCSELPRWHLQLVSIQGGLGETEEKGRPLQIGRWQFQKARELMYRRLVADATRWVDLCSCPPESWKFTSIYY